MIFLILYFPNKAHEYTQSVLGSTCDRLPVICDDAERMRVTRGYDRSERDALEFSPHWKVLLAPMHVDNSLASFVGHLSTFYHVSTWSFPQPRVGLRCRCL